MVASTKSMLSVFRPRALHLAMRDDGARPPMPARAPSAARRRTLARAVGVCVACVALSAPPLAAQLRPLEPLDWRALEPGRVAGLAFGAAAYRDQRASLAGTQGRLLEVGNFAGVWRRGAVLLEASGTLIRVFDDHAVFAAPAGGARMPSGERRVDAGDVRLATAVLLTPPGGERLAALRFGTRLPTTDNRVGLDRDQTDFFATLAGRVRAAGLAFTGEVGLGILGTRASDAEQSDVLLYAAGAEYRAGPITLAALLLGQADGQRDRTFRGNEDLRELRFSVRAGRRRWIQVDVVKGLIDFSPALGLRLGAGVLLGRAPTRQRPLRPAEPEPAPPAVAAAAEPHCPHA